MAKILVVDDERHILELLKFNLEISGYEVICSDDGKDCLEALEREKPDLVLLDWMLPGMSGIDILRSIREDRENSKLPVIMLTAKNMEDDKIEGLDNGADDYITKPFSIKELMARIKTVLRRYKASEGTSISAGDITLYTDKREVYKNGRKIDLTLKEFELLRLLIQNRGKVLTREELLDKVWGYEFFGETRTVDVHIRYLRKKLDKDSSEGKCIETIRGVGYKLV